MAYKKAFMLKCGGCRVANFCNKEHQRMASKSDNVTRHMIYGKHKDFCPLLQKCKENVVNGLNLTTSMRAEFAAFLERWARDHNYPVKHVVPMHLSLF